MPAKEEGGSVEGSVSHTAAQGGGGWEGRQGPVLAVQPYRTKEGEGGRKEEGPITGKGERGWSCVVVGPGRTQAGSGSGEDGTLPGHRPGHSIDIPDTGFPVMYG